MEEVTKGEMYVREPSREPATLEHGPSRQRFLDKLGLDIVPVKGDGWCFYSTLCTSVPFRTMWARDHTQLPTNTDMIQHMLTFATSHMRTSEPSRLETLRGVLGSLAKAVCYDPNKPILHDASSWGSDSHIEIFVKAHIHQELRVNPQHNTAPGTSVVYFECSPDEVVHATFHTWELMQPGADAPTLYFPWVYKQRPVALRGLTVEDAVQAVRQRMPISGTQVVYVMSSEDHYDGLAPRAEGQSHTNITTPVRRSLAACCPFIFVYLCSSSTMTSGACMSASNTTDI